MPKPWDDGMRSAALKGILRRIRNRWRLRHLATGASLALATGLVAFLGSAYAVDWFRFSPGAVVAFRWVAWGSVALVVGWFIVRPLARRVSDAQVALYLEEHEPTLEAAIMGAVEAQRVRQQGDAAASDRLLERLVARAVERAHTVDEGRRIDRKALLRSGGALAVLAAVVVGLLLYGPASLRTGVAALMPTADAASVNPYSIDVDPGDLTVARGSDQFVSARLGGFTSDEVSLFTRSSEEAPYRRLSMIPGSDGGFELLLLNLVEATDYFVESDGIRSPTFTIDVADLPYVDQMDHEYRFPAYTGLQPRVIEDAGDIATLSGTRVRVTIQPTISTPAGRIRFDEDRTVDLVVGSDGALTGSIAVDREGFYLVELAMGDGAFVQASPQYTIDLLTDARPSVRFSTPGRDSPASPIEEVYLEVEADDDYGVSDVLLAYSVNGQPEDTLSLFGGGGAPLAEVTAGHTLYLEDFELEPGDVVAYYAIARDHRGRAEEVVSDIYFVNVQPFGREFREMEQQGGQPQGGEQGPQEQGLSELQRQVVAATFNLNRDRDGYTDDEFTESAVSVALAQGRVREQVGTLAERMSNRGLADAQEQFRNIADMLPEAIEVMESAEALLREGKLPEALPPEQQALRILQKAEETYERYVTTQQQQGGGGGGGNTPDAEDLADLFELELDKLQNQYETVERGQRQEANAEVDELLETIEELARRQQQAAERQRARAQQGQAGGSSSGADQRELADETEEAARELERLARENGNQRLEETARQLQEAADAMRQSAAQRNGNAGASESARALDRLEEAQRRLEQARDDRLGEDAAEALRRAEALRDEQAAIAEEVGNLPADPQERGERVRDINERKTDMLGEVTRLEQDLKRLASEARREDPAVAREIEDAANTVEEDDLIRKIAWSRGVVEQREPEFARINERGLEEDLENFRREVEEAAEAAQRLAGERGLEDALEQAQDLVRGLESLDRRLDPQARQGGQGQGQEGEQGEGQRGQGQQQGQQGQQGHRGGGQQQGQQGQQGEGNPSDVRAGDRSTAGGATRGDPQPFTEEEIRQFRREFMERYGEAQDLREALRSEGREVQDLDAALRALEQLQQVQTYGDLPQIAQLRETLRETLGRLEFALRREVEGEGAGRAALRGSDDVPPGFQRLVEEYFRALARSGGGGGGGG